RGSSLCTVRSACAEGAGSPRLETAPRLGGARSREARTTRLLPAPDARSRRAGGRPEGGEVAPLVAGVEWQTVVRGVGRIDLGRAMTRDESGERFVDERGIVHSGPHLPGRGQQLCVDRGTDPDACQ